MEVTIGPVLLQSLDGKGMPSREAEEKNGHMENGAARSRTGRTCDEDPNETDGAAILGYVMWDFGFLKETGQKRTRGREQARS